MNFETENIEFKSGFTEEIYKEVIAFANTDGGVLYIGIDNDGNAVGLNNVDDEYTRITNGIRDAILPDVTMFVKYTIQENKVVRITISEGTNKPYYLRSKGLKSNGVYVRQGTSSVQASSEQIRQMITCQKEKYNWKFLFLGANIDAISTAKDFGISEEFASNYVSDEEGTKLTYEVMNETISSCRECGDIDINWKNKVEKDYEKRKINKI